MLIINIFSYFVMVVDKIKAIYKFWRISEKTIFLLAFLGGVFGVFLAMQKPFYHKAGKNIFKIGIPIIMLFWIFGIIYYFYFLSK